MPKPSVSKIAALALGLVLAGCGEAMHVRIGDGDAVSLAELDLTGAAPTALALASPDKVIVTEGEALDIDVTGDADAVAALRFNLEEGRLGIMREKNAKADGRATIAVTMPPARELVLAGSGQIQAPALVDSAEVNIAGSGTVEVARVAASRLQVNMMGSGTLKAVGTAERLDFNLAGSGKLAARGLKVERADINIAGSGGGEFASDGTVNANVAGPGEVTVFGRASCKISAMGPGKLRCRSADTAWDDAGPPTPSNAPKGQDPAEPPRPAE